MRAFLNLLAVVAMVAGSYFIGKAHYNMKWEEKMDWVDEEWYTTTNEKGEKVEWRDDNGKIYRANGCAYGSGYTVRRVKKKAAAEPAAPKEPEAEPEAEKEGADQ